MLDLPTFDRPRKATSGLRSRGHCDSSNALLTNFAPVTFINGVWSPESEVWGQYEILPLTPDPQTPDSRPFKLSPPPSRTVPRRRRRGPAPCDSSSRAFA